MQFNSTLLIATPFVLRFYILAFYSNEETFFLLFFIILAHSGDIYFFV